LLHPFSKPKEERHSKSNRKRAVPAGLLKPPKEDMPPRAKRNFARPTTYFNVVCCWLFVFVDVLLSQNKTKNNKQMFPRQQNKTRIAERANFEIQRAARAKLRFARGWRIEQSGFCVTLDGNRNQRLYTQIVTLANCL